MRNRPLFFLLLILLTGAAGRAQDSSDVVPMDKKEVIVSPEKEAARRNSAASRDTATYAAANDRRRPSVRSVDAATLRDIQSDRDYQYGNDVPPTASLWDRLLAWFWYKIGELLTSKSYRNGGRYVLLAGIAGLVIWLLYKANMLTNLFPNRARRTGLDYELLEEDIHQINFSGRINEAVENQNYRLAVRLLYLQTLKQLADGGLIRWQPDKTNRQYAYELTGNPKRLSFEQLTRQFEWVWYGDFPVDETRFGVIRRQFQEFNQ